MNKRFGMLFWLFAYGIILVLAACAPIIKTNGEILPQEKIDSLRVGVLKKDDVKAMLGSPSTISTFNPDVWHYIGQKVEQKTFGTPEVIDQKIIIVSFDSAGVLDAFVMRNLSNYNDITYQSRATPTAGHKLSALEQLLGNYGRFSSLPDEKQGGGK